MDGIWIHVCVWEPRHTLERMLAQQRALRDGSIAKLVEKHGKGDALREAMAAAKLVTMTRSSNDELECIECNAPMEKLISAPGVVDKIAAAKDIADNFDQAIDRTRAVRS